MAARSRRSGRRDSGVVNTIVPISAVKANSVRPAMSHENGGMNSKARIR